MLSASLAERARLTPGEVAIEIDGARPITWRDLDERAGVAAARLSRLGVAPGQIVLVATAHRERMPTAVHAVLRAGGVVLPVDAVAPAETLALHARRGQASWAMADPDVLEALGAGPIHEVDGGLAAAVLEQRPAIGAAGLAAVFLTSGSTGLPRGVMLTHDNLLASARRMTAIRQHGPADRHLSYLSFAHFAEQFMSCWLHVVAGYRVAFTPRRHLVEALGVARPTFLMGVPSEWQTLHAALAAAPGGAAEQREAIGVDRIRLALCTGAPLAPRLVEAFEELGLPICEMYGMTESTGAATYNRPGERRTGSVGRALPGSRIEVTADGEIVIVGAPFQSPGYVADPEETARTFDGDRIRTGDLGRLDDDGYLFLAGRTKELIILSTGKKVHPGALEARLAALPGVRHAAIFGDGAAFLVALVDADPGRRAEVDAAVSRLNEGLPRHERIRAHRHVAPFTAVGGELTSSLKVRRAALAERYAADIEELWRSGGG